jgi:hypothetical protein
VNDYSKGGLSSEQQAAMMDAFKSLTTVEHRGLIIATATIFLPAYVNGSQLTRMFSACPFVSGKCSDEPTASRKTKGEFEQTDPYLLTHRPGSGRPEHS